MRILFIHPQEFGIFPDIYEYSCLLRDAGFDVSYLGTRDGGEETWKKQEGISVCHLDRRGIRGKSSMIGRLATLVEAVRPDIAHVFQFRGCGLLPLLSEVRHAKWVVDIRTVHIADPRHKSLPLSPFKDKVTWLECQAYSHVLALTPFIRNILSPSFRPITLMSLGGSRRRLNSSSKEEIRAAVRERYGIHESAPLVLYAGSTNPARQLQDLLEAFTLASQEVPEARLMIVGADNECVGLMSVALGRGLEGRVTFVPWTPYKEVHQFFMAADIGVSYIPLSSRCRFQPPTKLIEYMMAGLVAVSNLTPATSQMITDGVDGVVCGQGPRELARAIVRAVRLLPEAASLRNEARNRVLPFDWDVIVKTQLIPFYKRLVECG